MGKIGQESVVCPALSAAYERAMQKAFDKTSLPSNVNWPARYGNGVSPKELLEGEDCCLTCGKKIEVDIHLEKIEGAVNSETGQPVNVYSLFDNKVSIKVSGTACVESENQK